MRTTTSAQAFAKERRESQSGGRRHESDRTVSLDPSVVPVTDAMSVYDNLFSDTMGGSGRRIALEPCMRGRPRAPVEHVCVGASMHASHEGRHRICDETDETKRVAELNMAMWPGMTIATRCQWTSNLSVAHRRQRRTCSRGLGAEDLLWGYFAHALETCRRDNECNVCVCVCEAAALAREGIRPAHIWKCRTKSAPVCFGPDAFVKPHFDSGPKFRCPYGQRLLAACRGRWFNSMQTCHPQKGIATTSSLAPVRGAQHRWALIRRFSFI